MENVAFAKANAAFAMENAAFSMENARLAPDPSAFTIENPASFADALRATPRASVLWEDRLHRGGAEADTENTTEAF